MTTTIRVDFDINPEGNFRTSRTLEVNRISGIGQVLTLDNQKFRYEAIVRGPRDDERLRVEFVHTYTDNVFILLEEALAAVRATGVTRL